MTSPATRPTGTLGLSFKNGRAHAIAVLEREGLSEGVRLVKVVRARMSCRIFAAWPALSMTAHS